jgi:hypothetical protein
MSAQDIDIGPDGEISASPQVEEGVEIGLASNLETGEVGIYINRSDGTHLRFAMTCEDMLGFAALMVEFCSAVAKPAPPDVIIN